MHYFLVKVLLYWIVGFVLALYLHEFGHLLVGLFHGWKFFMLTVGPVKLYREKLQDPIKLGFEPSAINWFGMGATLPPRQDPENLRVFGKILLGGPLSSILFGLLFLAGALCFQSFLLCMLSLSSLAIGIVNYIPMSIRTGFYFNDGTRFRRIRDGGAPAREEAELMNLIEKEIQFGEDVPIGEEECEALLASRDEIYRYFGYYVLLQSARKHDPDSVARYLAQAEALSRRIPASVSKQFPLEQADARESL
ncbi:MAG: M50 family metallopeptidase [Oscillospiraceae bacterium]|nr:M50 family metallopeptidase [Oscillospiraceae bacterium]